MQNDYKKEKQSQNFGGYGRSAVIEGNEQIKDTAEAAQKQLQEGLKGAQEQTNQIIRTVDKQVRENPWAVVAGVALGAFLLGTLMSRSK